MLNKNKRMTMLASQVTPPQHRVRLEVMETIKYREETDQWIALSITGYRVVDAIDLIKEIRELQDRVQELEDDQNSPLVWMRANL